ncbi:hypothetical protein [Pseudomonas syringae]|uniref:Uncharacterized protein n=1 Tax=Pseudomonas syringae TaxID=317 RepID=A0A085VQK3_PSESX|nr:hypothetical protein [Pseudomonas syringae]KFE57716.1 hypothetical protein IV01_02625 [Pseudomonas syringae]
MEINNTIAAKKQPLKTEKAANAQAAQFAEIFKLVTKSKPTEQPKSAPATLTRPPPPRSPLELKSLNPVGETHKPQAAAMERVGNSRVLPFVSSSNR